MSLENYLAKSNTPAVEIRYAFSREEVEQLYKTLQEIGFSSYLRFVRENLSDILKYIGLSDSQRSQKKWVNHPQNLLLRMAALQISDAAVEFQQEAYPICGIVDSGSYRKFHAVIAGALSDFLINPPLLVFPFEGYADPFEKKKN